ncbi:polyprenyl synthetase family protein [Bacillus sp. T33-2]|uniref:polyprenyl synthetase family protein n=1 Tax=Bacillus sp. T33-2 TaxID=2054168 RepID=UPI000C782915|nr:farnesyl diphosphate synthase [Bacillus sp. T33-2]PLR99874.1 farnesyl-diphosphate synthase [Bacillus sp. T33-2]
MPNSMFATFSKENKQAVEDRLSALVGQLSSLGILKEAMLYSLEAGGKRIRPLLLFATLKAFGQDPEIGLDVAAAIEMIHTYSLIHDDLPSMDDDDLRRGKPTNHKVFGEATAILAGDALLTYSFQLLAEMPEEHAGPDVKLALIRELSKAAGAEGMVGGQAADMEAEGKQLSLGDLEYIHMHKTGRLLGFSVLAGAELAKADLSQKRHLSKFAYHIGLAFQIRDDILDLEGEEELIGKPVGSDNENNKNTYPSLLTMQGAKTALKDHIVQAKVALAATGLKTVLLEEITDLIGVRDH